MKAFIVRRKSGFWPFDNGSRIGWEQPNSNIQQKEVSRIPECQLRKENRSLSLIVCFLIPFPAASRDAWCLKCINEESRKYLESRNWRTADVQKLLL